MLVSYIVVLCHCLCHIIHVTCSTRTLAGHFPKEPCHTCYRRLLKSIVNFAFDTCLHDVSKQRYDMRNACTVLVQYSVEILKHTRTQWSSCMSCLSCTEHVNTASVINFLVRCSHIFCPTFFVFLQFTF